MEPQPCRAIPHFYCQWRVSAAEVAKVIFVQLFRLLFTRIQKTHLKLMFVFQEYQMRRLIGAQNEAATSSYDAAVRVEHPPADDRPPSTTTTTTGKVAASTENITNHKPLSASKSSSVVDNSFRKSRRVVVTTTTTTTLHIRTQKPEEKSTTGSRCGVGLL